MSLKGVVDCGSNTVRLVVYEVKDSDKIERAKRESDSGHTFYNKLFRKILDEKKVAGLSAYVGPDGNFTKDGIACAVDVLSGHLQSAHNIGCNNVHIFATAVLRNCANSQEAVGEIERKTGAKIDLISDEDEGHLGFVGASCDRVIDEGTLIDIGGGSTELTAIRKDLDKLNLSIPQGSVSSYAKHVAMILPTKDETGAIEQAFRERLAGIPDLGDYRAEQLFGIGGSVRGIDKLYATAYANEERLETLESYQVDALRSLLEKQPSKFAHAATKAVPDRLHTIVPGLILTQVLMETLGADKLSICKYGVREGYLLERVLGI